MPLPLLLVPIFELLAGLAFVALGASATWSDFRYTSFLFACAPILLVCQRAGRGLTLRRLTEWSALLSLVTFVGFVAFGSVFPGIRKDTPFTSAEFVMHTVLVTVIAFVAHVGELALAWALQRAISRLRRQRAPK